MVKSKRLRLDRDNAISFQNSTNNDIKYRHISVQVDIRLILCAFDT